MQNFRSSSSSGSDNNNNRHSKVSAIMKQNEVESPTLPYTSSGEDDFKTTTRLGRILPSDDDEDDQDGHHRREDEGREEYESTALLQAVDILTQLAIMEPEEYQQRLVNNTLPSTDHRRVLRLSQSIHRFQSTTTMLMKEYDRQTTEVVDLQKQVNESRERITKLEKAVTKLLNRNTKLKKQNRSEKSVARKLIEQVRQFRDSAAQRKEEADFYRLASKVQQHEQALRERSDSNYSDHDSVLSSVSGQSLVIDDGIATVKIHRDRTLTWPRLDDDDDNDDKPAGHPENPAPEALSPTISDSNPFAKFLAPRPAQPYSLALLPPCTLQFVALHVDQPPSTNQGIEPPSVGETAFCVCGYHGFDTSINVKPPLGARLMAINGAPVNLSWTIHELERDLEGLEKAHLTFRNDRWDGKQKEILNMAIQEQKRLHPPPQRNEVGPFLRRRAKSGDSPNQFLSFWNFHSNGSSNTLPKVEPDRPETPPDSTENHQDDSPSNCGFSAFWTSSKTPSPKNQSPIDEELFAAGLAMPDVTNEQDDDAESNLETVPERATTSHDSPLQGAFSSFWKSSKTPSPKTKDVNELVATNGSADTDELKMPGEVEPELNSENCKVQGSEDFENTEDNSETKASSIESTQNDSPLSAFSSFWKATGSKKTPSPKIQSPLSGDEKMPEKADFDIPNIDSSIQSEDPPSRSTEKPIDERQEMEKSTVLEEPNHVDVDCSSKNNSFVAFWMKTQPSQNQQAGVDDQGTDEEQAKATDDQKDTNLTVSSNEDKNDGAVNYECVDTSEQEEVDGGTANVKSSEEEGDVANDRDEKETTSNGDQFKASAMGKFFGFR